MPTNIIIIGAGPAGETAATALRRLSPKNSVDITLIERDNAGGLCLNKGCIPSKTLLEQVHTRSLAKQSIQWEEIQAIKQDVVMGIRTQLEARLTREKITLLRGTATFTTPTTLSVEMNGKREELSFDKAVIAAGTGIYFPAALDPFKNDILNSDTVLELDHTPKSVVIVGGGAVGCEFACLLQAAGTHVTLIEMKETLLPGEDAAVAQLLAQSFEQRGIVVKTGMVVKTLKKNTNGWAVTLSNDETFQCEKVLSCVGRTPSVHSLGLEKANVQLDKNRLVLNTHLQTTNANIYAVGDIAGSRLAHHAAAQGETVAVNILGGMETCDERFVPRCLYSWPEVASVGVWKYQLEEKNLPVKTSRAFFKGSAKALAAGEPEGFVQIVSDPDTKKILGAQIIGAHATELIHIFSVALKANMTTKDLSEVMFAHPTLSELIKEAAKK